MALTSDQQYLLFVKRNGPVGPFDLYKAAIAISNLGSIHEQENELNEVEVTLLNVRRILVKCQYDTAEKILQGLKTGHPLLEGDKHFLLGQVYHRKGNQIEAHKLMNKAGDLYQVAQEFYRELRARINGAICISTLESSLFGELFAYEQEARRFGFLDLAANICRSRAMDLLVVGRHAEAHTHAMKASDLYLLDGYPEDMAVSIVLAAIALHMKGDAKNAKKVFELCLIKDGKVKSYVEIWSALQSGRAPKIYEGHPLFNVQWKKDVLKTETIPGKILNALKEKPCSKDELIFKVWGENALHVSYYDRLHSAITYLRNTKGINVVFNGEKYTL